MKKEMQSKDLRIGNLTNLGKVILIDRDVFRVEDNEGDSFKNTWSDILPIGITEEWLLKFGFEKELDLFYRKNKSQLIEIFFHDSGIVITTQSVCLNHIKNVHQLQNLYFALTNEELTLKA